MYFNRSFRDGDSFYSQLHRGIGSSRPTKNTYLLTRQPYHRASPLPPSRNVQAIHFNTLFGLSLHRAAGPPPPSTYPIPWQPSERGETPEMSVFTGDPDPDRPPSSTLRIPIQPKRARVAWLGGMRFTTARQVDNGMDINTPVQTPIRILAAKVRVCIQDFGLRQNSESDISYTDHGSLSALDMNYAALGAS